MFLYASIMALINSAQICLRLESHWSVSLQLAAIHTMLTLRNWLYRHKSAQIQKMQMMDINQLGGGGQIFEREDGCTFISLPISNISHPGINVLLLQLYSLNRVNPKDTKLFKRASRHSLTSSTGSWNISQLVDSIQAWLKITLTSEDALWRCRRK